MRCASLHVHSLLISREHSEGNLGPHGFLVVVLGMALLMQGEVGAGVICTCDHTVLVLRSYHTGDADQLWTLLGHLDCSPK